MKSSSYRWVILSVCTLGFMQTHIHRVGFAPLIPTFVADLQLTYAAAGAIMTAYFWTYTAVQVPIGLLVDRWGARRVMVAFMAVLVLGAALFPLSRTYTQSLLARALVGLGAAAVWVPSLRLITEWFRAEERGRVIGILSAGGALGGTSALLLIPLLADRWGWRWGYAATLVPVLLTLALFALFVRGGDGPSGAAPGGGLLALRRVLGTGVIWWFNVSVLLFYGAYFSMVTWLPTFLVNALRVTPAQAGFVTSLLTAGTIVSWPLAGLITDRIGRRKWVYLFSQLMSVAVSLVFALAGPHLSFAGAAGVALAAGVLFGGMITPFVMVVELFPRELAGTASGIVNTFCFLGSLIIPVLLGRVVDVTGSFPAAFLAAAAVQALAFVTACFTRDTGGRAAPA
ncbi:MAG: major facilitator transporter [Candidatus Rokubacteria bacterium CSP1-6]|nr:MAG: major facilitator transporter [Candidatus Rokubacteria bacterium CSP1-6]